MSVTFFIKNRKLDETSIYCSIITDGLKSRIVLKVPNVKIHTKDWDNGKIKTGKGLQHNSKINTQLELFKRKLDDFRVEFQLVNSTNPLKNEYENFIKSGLNIKEFLPKEHVVDIIPILKSIIKDREEGVELNGGKRYRMGTVNHYKSTLVVLSEYSNFSKNKLTNLSIVKEEVIKGFQLYLTHQKKLLFNTIANKMKILKALIEVLVKRGVIPYNPFKKYGIKVEWERGNGIALTEVELKELIDLDLTQDLRLERVRDTFLVMIFTGIRISDLRSLNDFEIKGKSIRIHNVKTGGVSIIPLFDQTKRIFEKYSGKLPELISEQKFRLYLKEVGKLVPSLSRKVQIQFKKEGRTITELKNRFELISPHVSRRTLATFLSNIKMNYHEIMLITGHKSLRDFENYIRVEKEGTINNIVDQVNKIKF